jgi:hypothetical protein
LLFIRRRQQAVVSHLKTCSPAKAQSRKEKAFHFALGAFAPLREALIQTNPNTSTRSQQAVVMQFESLRLMNKSGRGQAQRAPAVLGCTTSNERGRAALAPFLTVLAEQEFSN